AGTYNGAAGYRGVGYCGGSMLSTTNIAENNVVFGGEDRLYEQIENTLFALDGDLYVVVTGCQVEIIGDDARGIARGFSDRNVIGVSTPGFLGNTLKGYDAVMTAIVENVIEPSPIKDTREVNIFGVVPGHDVFYRGNLDEIERLLGLVGVKANTFFGTGNSIAKLRRYGAASLSVVLAPETGVQPARRLQEINGTPYILSELPIGPSGTAAFLRQLGAALGLDGTLVERVIASENAYFYDFFGRIVDMYSDLDWQRYAITVADSYYAHALTKFVANDLGWIPQLTAVNDLENEQQQAEYAKRFDDVTSEARPAVVFEQQAGQIIKHVRGSWGLNRNEKYYDALSPAFVIGSGIEAGLAETLNANLLTVAFPVSNRVALNRGYAGFRGGLTLTEDLLSQLVSAR
ncbi:MAG: hypothetical protein LBK23_02820, partial [Oscillospiraceae bacterium]|nr:hypothetical protein [Oscillospiraceae bacterium]